MDAEIIRNLEKLRSEIPSGVELVAVSKFKPIEDLRAAYKAGQRFFGESRVQELLQKIPLMPSDVKWHFIGHLQTNKVKQLIGQVNLIESVDSEYLLRKIDEESKKKGCVTDVLLQVHVAQEETKFGFLPREILEFFEASDYRNYENIRIHGLMAMATNTDDVSRIREDFSSVADLFRKVKKEHAKELKDFTTLSMGMTSDWPIAVEEGATLIRIGSAIFGDRN